VEPAGTLGITQQLSNIDQLGESPLLFLLNFYYFIDISTVAEPVSLHVTTNVSDPEWIRIQTGQWIRIQEGKNDPRK
jgi:hypothetical protein